MCWSHKSGTHSVITFSHCMYPLAVKVPSLFKILHKVNEGLHGAMTFLAVPMTSV